MDVNSSCNKDMEMDDFKWIWWMEYIHRMWGRLIGFTFVLPASYFWFRGALQPAIKRRLLLLGVLIGFQGLMGWHMVKSGLEDQFNEPSDVPRVSQYRLAAHLSLALLIYAGLLHISLNQLLSTENRLELCSHAATSPSQLRGLRQFQICARMSKVLIFLTAISGAFVAGLDAGLIYNSFPKMSNQWIPDDIVMFHPVWKNFTENPSLVQLDHRILVSWSIVKDSPWSIDHRVNIPIPYQPYDRSSTHSNHK
ncbi:hypothetical protein QAD02_013682 [Eretmocerus hayati]|uniref:Uncharacterized protein n=1 Tax=Eretmocerus hayati TaxID=131215 RepID=A0ACC2P7X8_9HYME|nr:hypothetical protein QAD02_013682 [Eretmocerus hayati]